MARITVEDCLEKIRNQYDLVLLAKERTAQLNAGEPTLVSKDNDKNTVISLREIGEGKISIKNIEDSAINKLMKIQNEPKDLEDLEFEEEVQASKTVKDPSYEHLGKRITNLMLEFDKVDVTGNEPLKMKRKAAIKRIQILGEKVAE